MPPSQTRSKVRRGTPSSVLLQAKSRFTYLYDMGDSWSHVLVVEKVIEVTGTVVPRCIAGARACPPEDCGGAWGYAELIAALADRLTKTTGTSASGLTRTGPRTPSTSTGPTGWSHDTRRTRVARGAALVDRPERATPETET